MAISITPAAFPTALSLALSTSSTYLARWSSVSVLFLGFDRRWGDSGGRLERVLDNHKKDHDLLKDPDYADSLWELVYGSEGDSGDGQAPEE